MGVWNLRLEELARACVRLFKMEAVSNGFSERPQMAYKVARLGTSTGKLRKQGRINLKGWRRNRNRRNGQRYT